MKVDSPEFGAVGAVFGAKTHTLSTQEMPAHQHTNATGWGAGQGGSNRPRTDVADPLNSWASGGSAGGGEPHNNLQPSLALTPMIKV